MDDALTPEQETELAAWLATDPEHVKAFVRETHAHRQLRDLLVARGLRAELSGNEAPASRSRRAIARAAAPAGRRLPPWAALAAAAAALLVALLLWSAGGGGRGRSPARPAPAAPAVAERPDAEERLAQWEAEQRRYGERLDALERRRAALRAVAAAPPTPAPGETNQQEALARIEEDRRTVEAEMARVVEAMRRAREAAAGAAPAPESVDLPPYPETARLPEAAPDRSRETAAAQAVLERAEGEVFLLDGGGARTPAAPPRTLGPAQGVATGAGASRAVVALADGTRLELGAATRMKRLLPPGAGAGRRVEMERGTLSAAVARQTGGHPLVLATPHAEAAVLGTRLTLVVTADATRLEVTEGRVRLIRRSDGASVEVGGGHQATAGPAIPLTVRPLRVTYAFQDGRLPDTAYAGTRDTTLDEVNETRNAGMDRRCLMDGDSDLADKSARYYALVRWDVSAIPPGSRVVSAEITLEVTSSVKDKSYGVYEVLRPWEETEATWIQATRSSRWERRGARGPTDRAEAALVALSPAISRGPLVIALPPAALAVVQSWVSHPAANFGVLFMNDKAKDGLDFCSREDEAPARRPRLTVTVIPPASAGR